MPTLNELVANIIANPFMYKENDFPVTLPDDTVQLEGVALTPEMFDEADQLTGRFYLDGGGELRYEAGELVPVIQTPGFLVTSSEYRLCYCDNCGERRDCRSLDTSNQPDQGSDGRSWLCAACYPPLGQSNRTAMGMQIDADPSMAQDEVVLRDPITGHRMARITGITPSSIVVDDAADLANSQPVQAGTGPLTEDELNMLRADPPDHYRVANTRCRCGFTTPLTTIIQEHIDDVLFDHGPGSVSRRWRLCERCGASRACREVVVLSSPRLTFLQEPLSSYGPSPVNRLVWRCDNCTRGIR